MHMDRRQFLVTSSAALAAGALRPWPLLAQAPASAGVFEALRRGVGIFTLRGGTIGWLVSPDAVVVIDSQYADSAPACLDGLKQRTSRAFDMLINTHHHADHTGGNGVFRPAVKRILAHARVPELQRMAAVQAGNEAQQVYPDATFTDVWREDIGKEHVAARHYGPAHTGGDAVITFERANVVHIGDLVFNRCHPRVDRPAGASIANWITSLERIPKDHDKDTLYIFGHGNPRFGVTGARADLDAMHGYLVAVMEHVRKAIAAGRSRDEIAKLDTLAGFPDVVPLVPSLSLGAVLGVAYDELTAGGGTR